jgi:uncharacterized protein YjcR
MMRRQKVNKNTTFTSNYWIGRCRENIIMGDTNCSDTYKNLTKAMNKEMTVQEKKKRRRVLSKLVTLFNSKRSDVFQKTVFAYELNNIITDSYRDE